MAVFSNKKNFMSSDHRSAATTSDWTGGLSQVEEEMSEYGGDEDQFSSTVFSTSELEGGDGDSERDEKKEVYKMSQKDTRKVQMWRVAVTVILLATACAVTLTTYKFLKDEEVNNFDNAFARFSKTLADAAIEEQQNIRDSLKALAGTVSSQVVMANLTWPNVGIDLFELVGSDALRQANMEFVALTPRVLNHQMESYMSFMNSNYQRLTEAGHMIKWGDLSHLQNDTNMYMPFITHFGPRGPGPDIPNRTDYWPTQLFSPPISRYMFLNHNMGAAGVVQYALEAMKILQYETVITLSSGRYRTGEFVLGPEVHASYHSTLKNSSVNNPHSYAIQPIHKDPTDPLNSEIVGIISSGMAFDASLLNLLPEGVEGIICVIVEKNQNQSLTWEVVGHDAFFLGEDDYHDPKYNDYVVEVDLALHTNPLYKSTPGHAQYKMRIYPSDRFRASYDSNTPEVFAIVVACTFVLVAIVFFVYDVMVFKRNENLVAKAAQSNAIVTSLFPEHMREALMREKEEQQAAKDGRAKRKNLGASLKDGTYSNSDMESGLAGLRQKPLADLYLETTVLFADIDGFTAWASVREPASVFTLLESIFRSFDTTAKRRKVFKVETVGDCYVAVAGLPDPRKDHAIMISRFARDILGKFHRLTKQLEVTLGPDTADLGLRIGVHSGQVTAGVLRGDRARFQLFGDTMNVCQKVVATGKGGRIHATKETAAILRQMGKERWLEKRSHSVEAKGLGILETYWLSVAGDRAGSAASQASVDDIVATPRRTSTIHSLNGGMTGLDARMNRLINWNVEMLLDLMQQIVARRSAKAHIQATQRSLNRKESLALEPTANPLDEVKEIITLPAFDSAAASRQQDPSTIHIPQEIVDQLHLLVSEIARMYNDNPFHNFDHASHVVMSVIKLMGRIVAPSHLDESADDAALHDHTYGITSDPLTQFACAFSALIHDADHQGVSNAQLVKEGVPIADKYAERSVAEQNSLDLTWTLLMEPRFDAFRSYLFTTSAELHRFRQLVVNSVMSTDIVDKEMKALRNARWEKAFKKGGEGETSDTPSGTTVLLSETDKMNRKATIVIEHIIQASDISHTMQHWHVYRKWNQNLFEELYVAYLNGRMEKNPVEFWYKGEFGFFDFYIIPITRKLKECGVFGVSSDEFFNYATKNREMWELHGEEAVAEMVEEAERKYGVKGAPQLGRLASLSQKSFKVPVPAPPQEQALPLPLAFDKIEKEVDV